MERVIFWVLSAVAVSAALVCVTRRSPVASALWLVLTMCALAGLFTLLDAFFIGVLQVVVYAGAVMVLFLFVIMLLNLGRAGPPDLKGWLGRAIALALALGIAAPLWTMVRAVTGHGFATQTAAYPLPEGSIARLAEQQGAVGMVADPLFHQYLVPFEVTSVLLLAAMVGAVVLAKRRV